MLILKTALVAGLVSLTACTTLGPDYQQPTLDWVDDWQPDLYNALQSDIAIDGDELRFWEHLLHDPVLAKLLDIVRRDSISLHIAGLRVIESRAQLAIAGKLVYPQAQTINGSVAYTDSRAASGGSEGSVSATRYQAGASVGWEIDFWGRFQRSIETADANFFGSVANQQNVQVLLVAQVADLYYQYRTLQQRIDIANQNADLQQRSFEITGRKFENGESSELDLQQAKSQYMATLSAIPDLELSLINVRNSLSLVLSRPPGKIVEITGELDELPYVKPEEIAEIPAQLLIRRPDVRLAAYQIAAQTSQIGIAEAAKYPSISLFGTIGWSGDDGSSSQTIQTISAGPSLSWTVFNYGRFTNNVRVQDTRLQQLIETYHQSVLQAAIEVDNAVSAIVKTHEQQQYTNQSLEAARRSLTLATSRYREGYADFQRVLDAQRSLFSQSERDLINRGKHVSGLISLYKALGGGWVDMSIEEYIPESMRKLMKARTDWGELLIAPIPVESSWLAETQAEEQISE